MELEKSQTWKNLETALSQEAVACAEYTFYAQQADRKSTRLNSSHT